jgi:hypothetical protein
MHSIKFFRRVTLENSLSDSFVKPISGYITTFLHVFMYSVIVFDIQHQDEVRKIICILFFLTFTVRNSGGKGGTLYE